MNVVQIFKGGSFVGFWRANWYWRVVSPNGQIVASSEGYTTKWNAKRAARRLFPDYRVVDLSKRR